MNTPRFPRALAPSLLGSSLIGQSLLVAGVAHASPVDTDNDGDDDGKAQVTISGLRSLLHDKLPDDPQDTPQSLTVVSDKLMQSQATTRLEDALKNVPGITLNAGEGAARG